jgi:hypothetical protein
MTEPMKKTYFFGWTNVKKVITELVNIYSNRDSFFSKKRIESGVAFLIGQWGMITFLVQKMPTMQVSDLLMWAGVEFAIAGFIINQIQKEKSSTPEASSSTETDQPTQINS